MVRRWKPLQDSTYRGSVTRVQPGFEASRTSLGAMARMMADSTPLTSTSATATDEKTAKPVTVYVPIKLTATEVQTEFHFSLAGRRARKA